MSYTVHEVSDGGLDYPREALLPVNASHDLVERYPPTVSVPYRPLLLQVNGCTILLDTGAGPLAPSTGLLQQNLREARVTPEMVNLVILTHAHADHIGGLLRPDGQVAFPNARVVIGRKEYEFWRSSGIREKLGTGSVYGSAMIETVIKQWFERYLLPLERQLELAEDGTEVSPGVTVLAAPGHTPGHMAVLIADNSEPLLFMGDAFALPEHIAHPEWTSSFDLDEVQTVETRRALLDRAVADRCRVVHYHLPGIGHVARRHAGYVFEPEPITAVQHN